MKLSNILKKYWLQIFIYPLVLVILFFATCGMLNFILVPANGTTILEDSLTAAQTAAGDIDIAFLGASRTYRGIDAAHLSTNLNQNIYNISHENATYLTQYYLLKELCKTKKINSVYVEVSIANFVRVGEDHNYFAYKVLTGEDKQTYAEAVHFEYDNNQILEFKNHLKNFSNGRFWSTVTTRITKNTNPIFNEYGRAVAYGHGFYYAKRKASNERKLQWFDSFYSAPLENYCSESITYFFKILDFCQANDIAIKLYQTPFPLDIIKNYTAHLNEFDTWLQAQTAQYNLEYYDFAKLKKERLALNNDYFYDFAHCNGEGAFVLRPNIESLLQAVSAGTYQAEDYFYPDFDAMVADYANN